MTNRAPWVWCPPGGAGGSKRSSPRKVLRTYIPLSGSPEIWYKEWAETQTPLRVLERAAVRDVSRSFRPLGRRRPRAARRIFVQGGGGGGWARVCRRCGPVFAVLGAFGWNRTSSRDCTRFLSGYTLGGAQLGTAIGVHRAASLILQAILFCSRPNLSAGQEM